jgi:hypothetical protein
LCGKTAISAAIGGAWSVSGRFWSGKKEENRNEKVTDQSVFFVKIILLGKCLVNARQYAIFELLSFTNAFLVSKENIQPPYIQATSNKNHVSCPMR